MMTHAERALANHRLASVPDGPDAPDREWRITMYFYAAVHAASHALFPDSYAPSDYRHPDRRFDMGRHKTLRTVTRQYILLEELANRARYLPSRHPMSDGEVRSARLWATEIMKRAGIDVPVESRGGT